MNFRKILLSVLSIGVVAVVAFAATSAFFSDTETSVGNTFVAGALDLKIDNESYAVDCTISDSEVCTGALAFSEDTSWSTTDLTRELFFNFFDLKPGDFGEDTISIDVDNDAWLCMDWNTDTTPENGVLDPETEAGDDGGTDGELQNYITFIWWVDDGDNVLEEDEEGSVLFTGTLAEMNEFSVPLADNSNQSVSDGPIPAGETFYIGKAWCFGELTPDPADPGDEGDDNSPPTSDRGPGVECSGEDPGDPHHNIAMTDSVEGTMSFYAEQARHNDEFVCNPPED